MFQALTSNKCYSVHTTLSIIFLAILGSTQSFSDSLEKCEPIRVQICKDLLYNQTYFPNIFGHKSQGEAREAAQHYHPLIQTSCSPYFKFFLCSLHFPICTILPDPLLPCRSLCEKAKDGCDSLLNSVGLRWPNVFNCSNFPESELCIGKGVYANDKDPMNLDNDDVTKPKDSPDCPSFMKVDSNYSYGLTIGDLDIQHCGMPCDAKNSLNFGLNNSTEDVEVMRLIICIIAFASALCSLLAFVLFAAKSQQFRYPEKSVAFVSLYHCVTAITYVVGFALGNRASCTELPSQEMSPSFTTILVSQGVKNAACTALFGTSYFASFASLTWWNIMTLTWFFSTGLQWSQEAVDGLWHYYHISAWVLPSAATVVALLVSQTEGDALSGICRVGSKSNAAFNVGPLALLLALGAFLFAVGLISIHKIEKTLKKGGHRVDELKKLIKRMSFLVMLYIVPNAGAIGIMIYEVFWHEEWMKGWFHDLCIGLGMLAPNLKHVTLKGSETTSHFRNWTCGDYSGRFAGSSGNHPNLVLMSFKHVLILTPGIVCALWAIIGKIMESCCTSPANKRPPRQEEMHSMYLL